MKKSDFVEIINMHKEMLQNAFCKAVDSKAVNYSCGDAYICLCSSLVSTMRH